MSPVFQQIVLCGVVLGVVLVAVNGAICNDALRNELSMKCENTYDLVSEAAQDLPNERDREETLCCALEDLEVCSMKAYDISHCKDEKPALRENLKAARLFLSVISNVTCNEHKARCTSASSTLLPSLLLVALTVSPLYTYVRTLV